MPLISLIAAISENRILSDSTQEHIHAGIPWNIPSDELYYRETIRRHPVIIGRKSYATFNKPIRNCTTIILTKDTSFQAFGCIVLQLFTFQSYFKLVTIKGNVLCIRVQEFFFEEFFQILS